MYIIIIYVSYYLFILLMLQQSDIIIIKFWEPVTIPFKENPSVEKLELTSWYSNLWEFHEALGDTANVVKSSRPLLFITIIIRWNNLPTSSNVKKQKEDKTYPQAMLQTYGFLKVRYLSIWKHYREVQLGWHAETSTDLLPNAIGLVHVNVSNGLHLRSSRRCCKVRYSTICSKLEIPLLNVDG